MLICSRLSPITAVGTFFSGSASNLSSTRRIVQDIPERPLVIPKDWSHHHLASRYSKTFWTRKITSIILIAKKTLPSAIRVLSPCHPFAYPTVSLLPLTARRRRHQFRAFADPCGLNRSIRHPLFPFCHHMTPIKMMSIYHGIYAWNKHGPAPGDLVPPRST